MSLTRIGSIGINTGIAFAGVTTIVTLNTANDALSIGATVNVGSGITLGASGDIFATGVCTATSFSGSLAASNLTGALPAISGANLTNLDASDLASGTVPTARLGSGTASSSTFLRGDSTFAAVTSTTINNNADNRLITGSGTANTLNGESGFTFNGSLASIANSSGPTLEITTNTNASDATLRLSEGAAGSTSNGGGMFYSGADNKLHITCGTDSTTKRITINRDDGLVGIGSDAPTHNLDIHASGNPYLKLLRSGYNPVYIGNAAGEGVIETTGATFFKTGGSERLRIASDGDLTLTGADNVEIKMKCGTSSGNNIIAFQNSGATTRGNITYDSDNNFLLFNVNQGERMRITSEGRMGLKTTSPDATLHIGGIIDNHPVLLLEGGGSTTGDLTVPAAENLQVGHWDSSSNTYTNRLQITTGTGNVTMPSQACMVFVDPVDISTVSNAGGYNLDPIHFNTQHINQGGVSSSNTKSRITVPTAGTYLVQGLLSGSLTNAAAGDGIQLKVKRNGSIYPNGAMWPAEGMGDYNGKEYAFSFSVPMTLAANDYVEIVFDNIGGSIQYNLSYGYFAVSLMF